MPNILVVRNTYPDLPALKRVLRYVDKTQFLGGYAVDPDFAFDQMRLVKEAYHKTEGVQLKHFIVSFSNGEMAELDFQDLMKLGFEIGEVFGEYQMVYCIHLDSDHTHIHFVMNTVSFLDGRKYSDGVVGFQRIKQFWEEKYPKFQTKLYFRERFFLEND